MKIDTLKSRLHRKRTAYKRNKRQIKLATLANFRKRRKNKNKKRCWWDETIPAPNCFGVFDEETRNQVLHFLRTVSLAAAIPNKTIRLDFSNTYSINSAGGILLRANLCKIKANIASNTYLKCAPSKHHKINEVLTQIEVLKLFDQNFNISPNAEDVIHWKIAQGSMVEGKHYETILSHYDGSLPESLQNGLYKGITEAMTNTKHHAYVNGKGDCELPQWWLFSQEKDDRLSVVFIDLGMGIPRSIEGDPTKMNVVLSFLKRSPSDADIISTAIKLGETSTGLGWRGKGLRKLKNSVMAVENSNMCIYSSRGMYLLNSGSKEPELKNFEQSIGGTMIYWSVPNPK